MYRVIAGGKVFFQELQEPASLVQWGKEISADPLTSGRAMMRMSYCQASRTSFLLRERVCTSLVCGDICLEGLSHDWLDLLYVDFCCVTYVFIRSSSLSDDHLMASTGVYAGAK
jgi:hypothetical protein